MFLQKVDRWGNKGKDVILFFNEDVSFVLRHKQKIRNIIKTIISNNGKCLGEVSYIFCTDEYLYNLNIKYLQHDTYTDVITFDYCEGEYVNGEIYISLERVQENAKRFHVGLNSELYRVIFHAILHLVGYKDKTPNDKHTMTTQENYYLGMLQ